MSLFNVIVKPIVTEKTAIMSVSGKNSVYTVEVSPSSTKVDVKNAFKTIYGVDVEKVNIVKTRQKFKYAKKGMVSRKKESKKAYVTLKEGQSVDFLAIK